MSLPRVAFLGLGIMGSGMARRLLAAGFPLTVYNRDRKKAEPFAAEGARVAASPRDAATGAQFIVSMVADDNASQAMWLGPDGSLSTAQRGAVLIDCSTVTVDWIRKLAAAAQAQGCELLDAPVTGSKTHSAAGELNFLVGGSAAALESALPLFTAMGKTITHLGPTGSGALVKLINNFVCGVQAVALAEATALIEQSGLDRDRALDVLINGAPGSPLVKLLSTRMKASDYTPNFMLRLMAKDLGYALNEGEQRGISLTTATTALKAFKAAEAAGNGGKDFSVVVEQFRKT
jgi:3-hydroxyisobutyrate dehydrogenase